MSENEILWLARPESLGTPMIWAWLWTKQDYYIMVEK